MTFEVSLALADEVRRVDSLWDSMTFRARYLALENIIQLYRAASGYPKWGSETDLSGLFKHVIVDRFNSKGTLFWGTHHFTYMNAICRTDENVREICFQLIDEHKALPATVNAILRHAKDASQKNGVSTKDVLLSMIQMIRDSKPSGRGLHGAWSEDVEANLRRAFNLEPLPKKGQRRQRPSEQTAIPKKEETGSVKSTSVELVSKTEILDTSTQKPPPPREAKPRVRKRSVAKEVDFGKGTRGIVTHLNDTLEHLLEVHLAGVPEGQRDPIRNGARRLLRECLDYTRRASDRISRIAADERLIDERQVRAEFESAYRAIMGMRPSPGPFLDITTVRTVYRDQVRSCHPDHTDDPTELVRYRQITEHYTKIRHYFEKCRIDQAREQNDGTE